MPTMEEVIAMHKAKPMPIIKVPNFLRYRFDSVKKVKNPFLSSHLQDYNWKYWRAFEIVYFHQEVDTFSKEIGWYPRYLTIKIPKLLNHSIKFLFGKRFYSVSRTYQDDTTFYTEMVDRKTKNNYINEFKKDNCKDIHVIWKEIRYDGWLLITKDEKKRDKGFFNFLVNLWS